MTLVALAPRREDVAVPELALASPALGPALVFGAALEAAQTPALPLALGPALGVSGLAQAPEVGASPLALGPALVLEASPLALGPALVLGASPLALGPALEASEWAQSLRSE